MHAVRDVTDPRAERSPHLSGHPLVERRYRVLCAAPVQRERGHAEAEPVLAFEPPAPDERAALETEARLPGSEHSGAKFRWESTVARGHRRVRREHAPRLHVGPRGLTIEPSPH